MSHSHHSKRAVIELEMIVEEGRRLRPLLPPDEWREKQKELAQRAGIILQKETERLEAEAAAIDAELVKEEQNRQPSNGLRM